MVTNFLLWTQIPRSKYLYTSKVPKSQINKCFWLWIRIRLEDGRKQLSCDVVLSLCLRIHKKKITFSRKPTINLLQILRKINLFTRKDRISLPSHHFQANQTNSLTFYATPPINPEKPIDLNRIPKRNKTKLQSDIQFTAFHGFSFPYSQRK